MGVSRHRRETDRTAPSARTRSIRITARLAPAEAAGVCTMIDETVTPMGAGWHARALTPAEQLDSIESAW